MSFRSDDVPATRTWEVDASRSVDYDDGDEPIGVKLLAVSRGVDLTGLPRAEEIVELMEAIRQVAVAS